MLAGVDEAGRGCLAGPVVAGAVILPYAYDLPGLTDSKRLSAEKRFALEPVIKAQAAAWGIGVVWAGEIDRINILNATFRAMALAVAALKECPSELVIDGDKIVPSYLLGVPRMAQRAVVKGDLTVPAVSAASILAKTFRDRLMDHLDRRYPGYGLAGHKGYGTAAHLAAIKEFGPCRLHRLTFKGVRPEPGRESGEWLCLPIT